MSQETVKTKLNEILSDKESIKSAIQTKTGENPGDALGDYADIIAGIETGTDTSDANAVASDILLNKTAYVRGEKVTGSYVPENLDNVITAQETLIQQLKVALQNKTAGGEVKPNIFVQPTEPSKKEGIWLKTNGSVDHYIIDDSVYTAGNWSAVEDTTQAPSGYTFSGSVVVTLGTDIYLFGAYTYNGAINVAYKYDTLTDTYTRLTDVPYTYSRCCGAAVGTDIFLFGVGNNSYIYKYDTLTDTYTMMRVASIWVSGTLAVAIGTDIFLTGGNVGSNVYKYDTLTDKTTNVGSLPIRIAMNGVAIGTDIYVFGGENTGNDVKAYKYDTLTNTYTELADCPITMFNGKSTAIGTDIYLMTNNSNSFYKYNISANTYTQLTNIPFSNYMR